MNWEEAVLWLRKQKDKQDLVRACFFDDPLIDAARRYYESREWKEVKGYLPKKKGRVLDIGAGRGISSYAFARDGWEVTALEPDPSGIVGAGAIRTLVTESGLDIRIVETWGEKMPFGDASFDVVYMRQALHHAKNLVEFCNEAGRILRPGGFFVATREHVVSKKSDLPRFLENHPLHKFYGGENAFLLKEYKKNIKNSGINITTILNPLESEINLFPETRESLRKKHLILKFAPDFLIGFMGNFVNYPGRLYSFIGIKRYE